MLLRSHLGVNLNGVLHFSQLQKRGIQAVEDSLHIFAKPRQQSKDDKVGTVLANSIFNLYKLWFN